MLHSFVFAPFADPAAEAQFDALHAQLQPLAATGGPVLLLGNLPLTDAGTLDAVVVRPAGIVLLLFINGGGSLHIPALSHGPWQLAGRPLTGQAGSANPYAQFQRQQRALAAWLTAQPGLGPIQPASIAGVALFAQPVTFGSEVEARLNVQTGPDNFQLLSSLPHLPRRLQRLALPGAGLPPAALQQWLLHLQAESGETAAEQEATEAADEDFWTHKARQLWRWLGAEDIPHDPPYGAAPLDAAAASAAEKQRLEQIRQQVRAELDQHAQAAAAREAEREQTIARLQAQLNQASAAPASAELQARLAAETREKAALEEAMRAARAETAARNRELDARIEQLGALIQQLQAQPAAPAARPAPGLPPPPAPVATSTAGANSRPAAAPLPTPRAAARRYSAWQLQPWRVAAMVAVIIGIVLGGWGLAQLRWGRPKPAAAPREARQTVPDATVSEEPAASTPTLPVDAAAAQLEQRLNNPVIDSTGPVPAATDSVQLVTPGYSDLDSLEDDE
jgi:hypothetical protein